PIRSNFATWHFSKNAPAESRKIVLNRDFVLDVSPAVVRSGLTKTADLRCAISILMAWLGSAVVVERAGHTRALSQCLMRCGGNLRSIICLSAAFGAARGLLA